MHLILTGATGLIGSAVLDAMIRNKEVTKISIISRRAVKMAEDAKDPRINVIIHKDFETYDSELLDKLSDATGCVWALGISQTQVGKEEYIKITKDFTLAAAKAFQALPYEPSATTDGQPENAKPPFRFILVSGAGTTFKPGPFTPLFGRVKGETELALADKMAKDPQRFRAATVRPKLPDINDHAAIKPYVPPPNALIRTASAIARAVAKSQWSPTGPLGRFLTEMAMGKWEGRLNGGGVEKVGTAGFVVVENSAISRVMGLTGKAPA